MKSLDFSAMENIQGGSAGNITLALPLSSVLGTMGLGSLLGLGLGLGLSLSYNVEGLTIPSLSGLGL